MQLWLLGREINIKIRKPVEEPNWPQLKHLTRLDKVPLDEWLKENSKEFGKEVGARCRAAVQDWMFQLENYPSDLSLLSTFFAADIVYLRLTNIQPTGVVVPRLLRYVHLSVRTALPRTELLTYMRRCVALRTTTTSWDEGTGVLVKKIVKSLRDRGAQVYYKHRVRLGTWRTHTLSTDAFVSLLAGCVVPAKEQARQCDACYSSHQHRWLAQLRQAAEHHHDSRQACRGRDGSQRGCASRLLAQAARGAPQARLDDPGLGRPRGADHDDEPAALLGARA